MTVRQDHPPRTSGRVGSSSSMHSVIDTRVKHVKNIFVGFRTTHRGVQHEKNAGAKRRRKCRQDTHSQHTFVQYSLFTSAERTPRAWLKSHGLQCHLCAPEKSLSSGVAHVSPFVVLSPAVYHEHNLPHSLFVLPLHKNTQHNK